MSAVGRRPESRTKEELKRELKKRGVEFHNNATKDELVRLFREQKVGRSAMELSSDEEGSRSPARRRKLAQKAAAANAELFLQDIRQLTDKELAAELKNYGFDGPVVATTRAVYERKLANFRAEDAKSSKGTRSKEEVDFGDLSDDSGSDQSSIGEDTPEPGRKEASVPLVAQYIATPPRQRASQHREGQHASQRLPKVESGSRQRAHQPLTGLERKAKPVPSRSRPPSHGSSPPGWCSCLLQVVLIIVALLLTVLALTYVLTGQVLPDSIAGLLTSQK